MRIATGERAWVLMVVRAWDAEAILRDTGVLLGTHALDALVMDD